MDKIVTTLNRKDLYRRLYVYIRPHWWRIALSIVASWGVAGTDAAMAKMVQPFVDRLIVAREEQMMLLVPLLIIGLQAGKAVFRYVQEYFIKTAGQLAIQRIRNQLFEHTMHLSMRFHGKTSTGVLMSKTLSDVQTLQNSTAEVLVGLMRDAITLVALTGVAFYTDWKMAAIAFIVLPVAVWPASVIGKRIKQYARRSQGVIGELSKSLEQAFSGIKVIKAFGEEQEAVARFRKENSNYYNNIRKVYKYDAAASPFFEILTGFGAAAVIWFGMQRVLSGGMTQGELFSIVAAIMLMYAPFKRLTKLNNYMNVAMGAAERVFDLLDEKVEIVDKSDAVVLGRVRGEVEFDGVTFAYDDSAVLDNFSLRAAPGEVIALVGPSGAGKSTIAALLCRFYDPTAGQILVDGCDLRQISIASLKENLAIVDQESFLFNQTIADNIRFSRPEATDDEVRAAARQAYAEEFILELPEGYDTRIGDRGLRLSGGQRQRICIARALLRNAPLLILDEATSALDTESEAMVQAALNNLMRDRTTFVIAHRLSTIMHASRIVVLDKGRVAESGTHDELLTRNGLYRRLYDLQFRETPG